MITSKKHKTIWDKKKWRDKEKWLAENNFKLGWSAHTWNYLTDEIRSRFIKTETYMEDMMSKTNMEELVELADRYNDKIFSGLLSANRAGAALQFQKRMKDMEILKAGKVFEVVRSSTLMGLLETLEYQSDEYEWYNRNPIIIIHRNDINFDATVYLDPKEANKEDGNA